MVIDYRLANHKRHHYCIDNTSKTANTLLAPPLIAHLERRMRGGEELTSVVEHQWFAVVPGTRHGRGPGGRAPSSRAPRTLIEDFGSYSSRVELYGARQASDAGTEDPSAPSADATLSEEAFTAFAIASLALSLAADMTASSSSRSRLS